MQEKDIRKELIVIATYHQIRDLDEMQRQTSRAIMIMLVLNSLVVAMMIMQSFEDYIGLLNL